MAAKGAFARGKQVAKEPATAVSPPESIEPAPPPAEEMDLEPQKVMSPEDFWRFTSPDNYKNRSGVTFRLYRQWPIIDRKLTGNKTTVLDKQLEMAADYVPEVWGGGKYKLYFHDANLKGKASQVCMVLLSVDPVKSPPRVDPRELLWTHPDNKSYVDQLAAQGIYPPGAEPPAAKEGGSVDGLKEAFTFAQSMMSRQLNPADLMKQQMEAMNEGLKVLARQAANPIEQAKQLKELLGGGGDNQAVMIMLEHSKQQHELNLKLLELTKQQAAPAPSTGNLREQLKDLAEVARLVPGLFGGGAEEAGTDWKQLATVVAGGLLQFLANRPSAPAAAAAPAPVHQVVNPAPAPIAPAAPVAVDPAAAAAENGDDMNLAQMAQLIGVDKDLLGLLGSIGERAVMAFRMGFTGDAFAESIERTDGIDAYRKIASFGKDKLLGALKMNPKVWAQVAPFEPQVVEFIDAFCDYGEEEESAG